MKPLYKMQPIYRLAIPLIILVMTAGCSKENDEAVTAPSLSTITVTEITSTGAVSGGDVTSDGGSPITARGICWSSIQNPTLADSKASDGSTGTGSFTCNIFGLTGNSTYYVRAYATNSTGTSYGDPKQFTTSALSENASTMQASGVTSATAIVNGMVNANYLSTEVYFEYGTTTGYGQEVMASESPVNGNSDLSVSAQIAGLTPVQTYHVRVRIENSSGIAFGNDITFFTNYVIGEATLGGIIFYTDTSGEHGLVCAEADQGSEIQWYNGSYSQTYATGIAIGTGKSNTTAIVAAQGDGNYAAKTCYDLTLNGYSDWFLPSIDELELIHSNASLTTYAYYWSSSEFDTNLAWYGSVTNLNYFGRGTENKSITAGPGIIVGTTVPYYIRPVREF